ncbi:hypothetical protein C1H46_010949 [Malus baccata]|uniref:Uncharacterized protein n=1 Tax=Malus baccata TaxID=106549 RepID=A0A540MXH4_MALBA|nr:hypothetical protein C1H46_010949 [Malus baccata]
MIHRAVLGSLKQFFGVLIEHYAGDFPLWLSPVQAHVLLVTDSQVCKAVARLMFQLTQEPSTHLHEGYLGYDPRLSSQRFDSFVDSESLKDSATDSPIFHGSAVDNAFATQPALDAFSPPLIYTESNGQGFDGRFGGSDGPILQAPSEMLPEEGFALREWRRFAPSQQRNQGNGAQTIRGLKWCLVRRREIHGSWHDHGHGHEEETLLVISKLLKELTEEEDMKVQIWISSARPRS